jgi:hypothetical protein
MNSRIRPFIPCSIDPNIEDASQEKDDGVWKIQFDGFYYRLGERSRILFTYPQVESTSFSYKWEFDCINNITKYETLLLGIELARDVKIKVLQFVGDSDTMVMKFREQFTMKNDRLKNYRHVVWDSLELFDAFTIENVAREENAQVDGFFVEAATL